MAWGESRLHTVLSSLRNVPPAWYSRLRYTSIMELGDRARDTPTMSLVVNCSASSRYSSQVAGGVSIRSVR